MIILFSAPQPQMAQQLASNFLKQNYPKRDETNYVSLDMNVSTLKDLVSECEGMSLFAEKKAVLAKDCYFLGKAGKKKLPSGEKLDALIDYCKHPNESVDLILLYYEKDVDGNDAPIDEKNPIVKLADSKASSKEMSEEDWLSAIEGYFERRGSGIDEDAAREFVSRINGQYSSYLSERDKLFCYSEGHRVTLEMVQALVTPTLEDDAFKLSNALLAGNVKLALSIYHDLTVIGTDEIRLISLLASNFVFLDRVSYLSAKGMGEAEIAAKTKSSPYRVRISLRNLKKLTRKGIHNVLENLYETDRAILSGEVKQDFAFERFLANFSLK